MHFLLLYYLNVKRLEKYQYCCGFLQLSECQTKLELKKKDIEKLLEREKALQETFKQSLGENNKFADYLAKVFKKKIKRKKKEMEGGGNQFKI